MFYDDFDGKNPVINISNYTFSLGIILVSDLTNRQSYDSIKQWLSEAIRSRSQQKLYEWFPVKFLLFPIDSLFSPTEFTSEILQNFDVPLLLIHTKFDESNGISLLNNSKSPSISSNQSPLSNSLLPNYNRKSPLANLFNCDEIFIVKISRFSTDIY